MKDRNISSASSELLFCVHFLWMLCNYNWQPAETVYFKLDAFLRNLYVKPEKWQALLSIVIYLLPEASPVAVATVVPSPEPLHPWEGHLNPSCYKGSDPGCDPKHPHCPLAIWEDNSKTKSANYHIFLFYKVLYSICCKQKQTIKTTVDFEVI